MNAHRVPARVVSQGLVACSLVLLAGQALGGTVFAPDAGSATGARETATSAAVPTQAVPTQAVPTQAVPTQAVPTQAVPTQAVPTQTPMPTQATLTPQEPCENEPVLTGRGSRTSFMQASILRGIMAQAALEGTMPAMCFVEYPTAEQLAEMINRWGLRAPTEFLGERFFAGGTAWSGNATVTSSGRATAASLSYSFVLDTANAQWINCATNGTAPSVLQARFAALFGVNNEDRGRELYRQALAGWRRFAGLSYREVADDGSAQAFNSGSSPLRGDIRVGGIAMGTTTPILACNFFPNSGGDVSFNTSYFIAGAFNSTGNNFRYFRNTSAHEHGHGLGAAHSEPCTSTKLMEPQISTAFDQIQIDDMRLAQGNYGDRYSGNNSAANATNFGDLTSRSVIEPRLSTNGVSGSNNSNQDWFRFTLTSPQTVTVTVTPVGGTYPNGAQTTQDCTSPTSSVVASQAGNLDLDLRDSAGTSVIQAATPAASGTAETLTVASLPAGTYTVRVIDSGPNPSANQTVQLYDLLIRVGTTRSRPRAGAGIDKRCEANRPCFFMGDINSYVTETGATINASTGYRWDFDNDGVFTGPNDQSVAQPQRNYVSNGVYPVTLQVTDSNGLTGTDTINVTVFGAFSTFQSVTPFQGNAGVTIPVTIVGTNFRAVTSASNVAVSGTGVTVIGTPVVDYFGTTITGLSFQIAPNAAAGARNVVVTTADGTALGTNQFNVTVPAPSNDNCAGAISWGSALGSMPFSNVGANTSTSLTFAGTACSGPVQNDVWYSWIAPATGTLTAQTDASGFAARFSIYAGTTCPPLDASLLACTQSNIATNISVVQGQSYLFQVGSIFNGSTGSANVILSLPIPTLACCFSNGSCLDLTSAACTSQGGTPQAANTTCSATNCPGATEACCFEDGTCQNLSTADCANAAGTSQGAGSVCATTNCPQPTVACCLPNGTCVDLTAGDCLAQSGISQGPASTCATSTCPIPTGPCCFADGSCQTLTAADCATASGTLGALGTSCASANCPQPTGACCRGATCSATLAAGCTGANSRFAGPNTTCNAPGNNRTPCCRADFTQNGIIDVNDIFTFLSAWFAASPTSDILGNGSGASQNVNNIFAFLSAWFARCN